MRRVLLAVALLAIVARSARAASCLPTPTGTVHYFCDCGTGAAGTCVPGSDAGNNGLTASTPWQTWAKLRTTFNAASPGDQVLGCQGGAWLVGGNNTFINSNCTAASRCSMGSYSPTTFTSTAKPQAYGSTGRGIDTADSGGADHEEGYVFDNWELVGPGGSTATVDGVYVFNDIDYVTMCNMDIHDWASGVDMTGSNTPNAGANAFNEHWTFDSNNIHDNNGQGHYGGDYFLTITNSTFKNNGFGRAIFNHNIYIGESGSGPDTDILVQGNDLYQSTVVSGTCQATSLVVHGVHTNLSIIGNTIHEDIGTVGPGCWGIGVVPGYASAESFTNVIIRGNTITNMGNSSISLGSVVGAVVENNVITNFQGQGGYAFTAPDQESTGDATISGIVVRNNSILQDGGGGISLGTEGTGHGVANNAIRLGAAGTCFSLGLASSSYAAGVDYNDCFIAGGTGNHYQGSQSLAAWQGTSSLDAHSKVTDPAFIAITLPYNLQFLNTSPLYNGGSTALGSSVDLLGVSRPQSTAADIGAYELVVGSLGVVGLAPRALFLYGPGF